MTMPKMKNTVDGINLRLDMAEEKISEFADSSRNDPKYNRKTSINEKTNRTSVRCGEVQGV